MKHMSGVVAERLLSPLPVPLASTIVPHTAITTGRVPVDEAFWQVSGPSVPFAVPPE